MAAASQPLECGMPSIWKGTKGRANHFLFLPLPGPGEWVCESQDTCSNISKCVGYVYTKTNSIDVQYVPFRRVQCIGQKYKHSLFRTIHSNPISGCSSEENKGNLVFLRSFSARLIEWQKSGLDLPQHRWLQMLGAVLQRKNIEKSLFNEQVGRAN